MIFTLTYTNSEGNRVSQDYACETMRNADAHVIWGALYDRLGDITAAFNDIVTTEREGTLPGVGDCPCGDCVPA